MSARICFFRVRKKKKRVFSLAGGEEFVCRFAGSLQIELNWGTEGGEREEKWQYVPLSGGNKVIIIILLLSLFN